MSFESLHNSGTRLIGDASALSAAEKTFVVAGPARSGTSLVAGALHRLGVFTGDRSHAPVFEDLRMARAFDGGTVADIRDVARDYDARHAVWAYKRPAVIESFGKADDAFRNPVYLFIFKDVFSVANRNSISMQQDLVSGMRAALDRYGRVLRFIERRRPNGMLLSYERILRDKESFVETLSEIVGPERVSDEHRAAALEFIEPDPAAYLHATRVTRAVGRVDRLTPARLTGFAKYVAAPERPITVEVYVNGDRSGLATVDEASTGSQGFGFAYTFDAPLAPDDTVAVKLSEDVVHFAEGLRVA